MGLPIFSVLVILPAWAVIAVSISPIVPTPILLSSLIFVTMFFGFSRRV